MTTDFKPPGGEMTWLIGHDFHSGMAGAGSRLGIWSGNRSGNFRARFAWLALVAVAGMAIWMTFPGPSGAQNPSVPATAPVIAPTQNTSWFNPAITSTVATLATAPADQTRPAEAAAVDGLSISSQSWRRGGLGSKALVTFTLRNGNGYAVKDIEISCAFARRDGSHLTGRKRLIHDTVGMKSRKTFARMHVGFVNINANQAKCSLVTASRI